MLTFKKESPWAQQAEVKKTPATYVFNIGSWEEQLVILQSWHGFFSAIIPFFYPVGAEINFWIGSYSYLHIKNYVQIGSHLSVGSTLRLILMLKEGVVKVWKNYPILCSVSTVKFDLQFHKHPPDTSMNTICTPGFTVSSAHPTQHIYLCSIAAIVDRCYILVLEPLPIL